MDKILLVHVQGENDVVFQILHYILTDGKEPTPFHVMVAQAVHSLTQLKELVTALCQHGVCVGYNTVRRIDVDLAEQVIATAGGSYKTRNEMEPRVF